jgi:hypothetical protein
MCIYEDHVVAHERDGGWVMMIVILEFGIGEMPKVQFTKWSSLP